MVAGLLWRGMIAGLLAGLLCFAFLRVVGEPRVERAIAFEESMDARKAEAHARADAAAGKPPHSHAHEHDHEDGPVSRPVQAGWGLLTATAVYGAALGGLFSLAYAFALGRAGRLSPRATAGLLALAGFTAVYMVPGLKYPANPPAVGEPDTIGIRTALYFGMVAASLVAAVAAGLLRRLLVERIGPWNAGLAAGLFYLAAVVAAGAVLPAIDEVPEGFPADLLYDFRLASLGGQALVWAVLGLGFGWAAERLARPAARAGAAPRAAPAR